jgi:hypothetical protein
MRGTDLREADLMTDLTQTDLAEAVLTDCHLPADAPTD